MVFVNFLELLNDEVKVVRQFYDSLTVKLDNLYYFLFEVFAWFNVPDDAVFIPEYASLYVYEGLFDHRVLSFVAEIYNVQAS